jgi:DMSO/TMAO reductase YedYZ molybdopterin-dependent catalytic subunit
MPCGRGGPLDDKLSMARARTSVKYIVFRCSNGYNVRIPLKSGLMEGAILAYDMNNVYLIAEHGYPV